MSDTETDNLKLEIYDPLDDPQFRCDVCKMTFYKRYMSLNGNKKAVERHLTTRTHKQNVERAAQGLAPQRLCNFTNMHDKMQELVDKMTLRISELETLVKSVADTPSTCDDSPNASNDCSVDEQPHQRELLLQLEQEEQQRPPSTPSRDLLLPHERRFLYDYDGESLANMRAVRSVLTRLLQKLPEVVCGQRYERNFQFVNRTLNAVSLQLERVREGYGSDENETDEIASRLIQIGQHQF